METNTNKQHYGSIDGVRTIAAIGILAMHVAANKLLTIHMRYQVFYMILLLDHLETLFSFSWLSLLLECAQAIMIRFLTIRYLS